MGQGVDCVQIVHFCWLWGQWRKRRRRRCCGCWNRHSPAAHREDHAEQGSLPVAHGGSQWRRSPPLAPGGPTGTGGWLKGAVTQSGVGLLAAIVTLWRIHTGSCCSWRTTDYGRDPHWVCEGLQPVEGTHVGKIHGRLSPMGATPHWSRGECEWSSSWGRRSGRNSCVWWTAQNPFFHTPCTALREEIEKIQNKVNPRKKAWKGIEGGERCFKI